MRTLKIMIAGLVATSAALGAPAQTQPAAQQKDWDYPELLVTPKASDRIEREAKLESRGQFRYYWPIQVPAMATLAASALMFGSTDARKDPDKQAALTGMGVGGGWLVATWLLSSQYRPYAGGVEEIAALPKGTPREQLARERAAEEAIEEAARLGTRLRWLSLLTNLGASAYMATNAESKSAAQIGDVVSMALAFTPVIFTPRWNRISREQQDYKKRIFSPLASTTLIRTSASSVSPALALTWSF